MIKFNPICVDNFFHNPDEIREFGLSLNKEPHYKGSWPGERTEELFKIDEDFNSTLILKILSSYFDLRYTQVNWKSSKIYFQLIKPYDKQENSLKNQGWIHQDNDNHLAGLIYLTPNADINSGTSIFKIKPEEEKDYLRHGTLSEKEALYRSGKILDKDYEEAITIHNNKFIETIRYQNIYNRMISYDSNYFHRANSFCSRSDDRLTLVYFIEDVKVDKYPTERVIDKNNFDLQLKRRINYLND